MLKPQDRIQIEMNAESKIFISHTDEFGSYTALKKSLNTLGIRLNFDTVCVKLNLCSLKLRETGATSDPIVVEQLVKILNENGAQVTLVESDSSSKDADLAFKCLGFKKLEQKYNMKCVNLSKDSFSLKKIDGYHLKSVKIPKTIQSADFFITHPKMKTHSSLGICISGSLKNQFGCLMEKNKAIYHPIIHEIIADVNLSFRPNLSIMDGIIAMSGYGPTNGTPLRLNKLIVSQDPVAVDCLAATLFGFNPLSIKYISLALRKALGNSNYTLCGEHVGSFSAKLPLSKKLIMQLFNALASVGLHATEY